MSEEKDASQVAAELASLADDGPPAPGTGPKGATGSGVPPQLEPSPGLPPRAAADRRKARVMELLHTLPEKAQEVIRASMQADSEVVRGAANGVAPDRAPANWLKDDGRGGTAPAAPAATAPRRPSPWPNQPDRGATDRGQGLGEVRDYAATGAAAGAGAHSADTAQHDQLAYPDGTLVLPPADEELGTYGTDGGPVGPAAEGSGQPPRTDGQGDARS